MLGTVKTTEISKVADAAKLFYSCYKVGSFFAAPPRVRLGFFFVVLWTKTKPRITDCNACEHRTRGRNASRCIEAHHSKSPFSRHLIVTACKQHFLSIFFFHVHCKLVCSLRFSDFPSPFSRDTNLCVKEKSSFYTTSRAWASI